MIADAPIRCSKSQFKSDSFKHPFGPRAHTIKNELNVVKTLPCQRVYSRETSHIKQETFTQQKKRKSSSSMPSESTLVKRLTFRLLDSKERNLFRRKNQAMTSWMAKKRKSNIQNSFNQEKSNPKTPGPFLNLKHCAVILDPLLFYTIEHKWSSVNLKVFQNF